MNDSIVRFGLVGFGLFGSHHARAIAQTDGAQLAAIAVHSERSRQAAREAFPDAEIVADYRQLLSRKELDVVDVVVPNALHFEVALAALEADKHVLLEKPMALSRTDCQKLVDTAAARQRTLAVGHELRLSSLWGGAKELISQGRIGRVQHVLIELSRFPYRLGADGWRWDLPRVGSWILEEPIHFFDLARWYLADSGEPTSIYARATSRHAERPQLRDNFSAIVNHADGAYAVVSQTLAAFGHHQTAKIVGAEGTIWAQWSAADARSDRASFSMRCGLGDQVEEISLPKPAGELLELSDEIAAVTRAVREGSPPPCTGLDGLWSTTLCLTAEESVDSGEIVKIG